jgi:cell division protein FtsQ
MAGMSVFLMASFLFLIQWDYLRAERVVISGAGRVPEEKVLHITGLQRGMNILSVNLSLARKRLLSQPWIAEASVGIGFPPEFRIRIREHEPMAVFELDRKYLANAEGRIFKEWEPFDTPILPMVSGLRFSDVDVAVISKGIFHDYFQPILHLFHRIFEELPAAWRAFASERFRELETPASSAGIFDSDTLPFKAVMNVLQFGKGPNSILPNRLIQDIRVDREMGITLVIAPENEEVRVDRIRLGYHHYPVKYDHLQRLFRNLNNEERYLKFHSIDLNNLDRIVVSPMNTDSLARDYKEDV